MKHLMTAVSALLLLGSCTDRFAEDAGADTSSVDFVLAADDFTPDVKSSYTWGESEINTVQIVIADASGNVQDNLYSSTGSTLSFTGVSGVTYYAWAAVNLGSKVNVSTLSDFNSGSLPVSVSAIGTNGIPMFSDGGVEFTLGSASSVTIDVTRMLARIDFQVVDSGLAGDFTVKSVKIHNGTSSYVPFASSAKETGSSAIAGFDTATSTDISTLNGGSAITLYAFENKQGDLLSGNTDPWAKVPSNTALSGTNDKCTYLEMTASYSYQGLSSDSIIYRMYLGGNATTNFDLARNTKYTVTLYPSEEEIDGHRGSWKVENSGWNDSRSLAFDPHAVVMESLETKSVSIIKSPTDLDYEFSYSAADAAAAWLTITRTGDSVSIVSTEELDSQKTVTLHVETLDGVKYDDCVVTVKPVASEPVITYELVVTPATSTLGEGQTAYLKATYYTLTDGVRDAGVDVTGSATWNIVSGSAYVTGAGLGNGRYKWKDGPGMSTVKATYSGCSGTATISTSAHEPVITYELEVTPQNESIEVGEGLQYTAMEYEYADGVYTGRSWDLTNYCSWSCSNSKASISSTGYATGVSAGSLTVTAYYSYDGVSDSASLTVVDSGPSITGYRLVIVPDGETDPEIIGKGETASFTAILYTLYSDSTDDGGVDVTTSGNTTWYVDTGSYVTASGKGSYAWKDGPGETEVTAKYSSVYSENYGLIITAGYELVVTPASQTIDSGETAYCTATLYTYVNGSSDGGVDVTGSATWSIVSGSSVTNDGDGEFSWAAEGTSTVKATYDGFSDTAVITSNAGAAPVTLDHIEVSDDNLVLGYDNGWAGFYTVTAYYSDNTSEDVTLSASYSKSGPFLIAPGSADATSEGSGTISVSYTYGGVTKYASVDVTCLSGEYWEGVNPDLENAHGTSNEWYFTLYADVFNHYTRETSSVLLTPGSDYSYSGTSGLTIIKSGDCLDIFVNSANQSFSFSATDPNTGQVFDDRLDMIHY